MRVGQYREERHEVDFGGGARRSGEEQDACGTCNSYARALLGGSWLDGVLSWLGGEAVEHRGTGYLRWTCTVDKVGRPRGTAELCVSELWVELDENGEPVDEVEFPLRDNECGRSTGLLGRDLEFGEPVGRTGRGRTLAASKSGGEG